MPELGSPYVIMLDVVEDEGEMYAEYLRPDAVVTRLRQDERGVNGVSVARQLKQDAKTENVPILIITTSILAEDRQAARDAHCDRYMLLPLIPEELADEIRLVLH